MGRLTLTVLLSFAQFEREVTGERIRDKIAASKKKGMWMGGFVPLGYDARNKKLIVNENEAEIVRHIYKRYTETGNINVIKAELDAENIMTKERTGRAKARWGQKPFTKGGLYRMLQNPIYIGMIAHKEKTYPGEHAAIIDKDLWDRVQHRINTNRVRRRDGTHAKEPSLLAGLLFDDQGRRLTPSHATKGERRYRYYVTPSDALAAASPDRRAWRIPAHEIESLVRVEILALLKSHSRLDAALDLRSASSEERLRVYQAATARADALEQALPAAFRPFLTSLTKRITIRPDRIDLEIHQARLKAAIHKEKLDGAEFSNAGRDKAIGPTYSLHIDTRIKRCGGETKLVLLGDDQSERL